MRTMLCLSASALALCELVTALGPVDSIAPTNVLLLVLDDVGRDKIGCYGQSPDAGPTPVIDGLAARGLRFDCAWATPYCSPTRATILTGRHPSRTGIGAIVNFYRKQPGLESTEWTLPEAARDVVGPRVRSAMIGKWHLAGATDGLDHARESGFDRFAGTMANLGRKNDPRAYWKAARVVDGTPAPGLGYATTVSVNDALAAIASFEQGEAPGEQARAPWFVMVSFHAAHFPLHAPPAALHDIELEGDPLETPLLHARAMVQALDREIGRLLGALDESTLARTTILVVGDNGTQNSALGAPFRRGTGKGTAFEPGVGVPLIVVGPGVAEPGRSTPAFAHTVDLFPTTLDLLAGRTLDLSGAQRPMIDGISLAPLLRAADAKPPREMLFTEWFEPNHAAPDARVAGGCAARRGRYKLIVGEKNPAPRLYDLVADPLEEVDLLAADSVGPGITPVVAPEVAAERDALLDIVDAHRAPARSPR